MEKLFTQALGLAVVSFEFKQLEGEIVFKVECEAKQLPCPACSAPDQPIHDRRPLRWQHLHFFQFRAFIDARLPRVACRECGKTTQMDAPWSRPGSGFSLLMEAFVVALCQAMPVAHVARLIGVSDDRLWRMLDHHVGVARTREDHAEVRRIGVDETSSRRGHRYISLFHDLDARRLLFATPERDAATFAAFANDLAAQLARLCSDPTLRLRRPRSALIPFTSWPSRARRSTRCGVPSASRSPISRARAGRC